jgi:hypothetical protein
MNSIQILVIGKDSKILATILRLIHSQSNWKAFGVGTEREAIEIIENEGIHLVLIGGGVDLEETNNLKKYLARKFPAIKLIQHYGGGSGLLFGEINQALNLMF